jgi:hypothetical protein
MSSAVVHLTLCIKTHLEQSSHHTVAESTAYTTVCYHMMRRGEAAESQASGNAAEGARHAGCRCGFVTFSSSCRPQSSIQFASVVRSPMTYKAAMPLTKCEAEAVVTIVDVVVLETVVTFLILLLVSSSPSMFSSSSLSSSCSSSASLSSSFSSSFSSSSSSSRSCRYCRRRRLDLFLRVESMRVTPMTTEDDSNEDDEDD